MAKKILALTLAILTLLSFTITAFASDASKAAAEKAALEAAKEFDVTYEQDVIDAFKVTSSKLNDDGTYTVTVKSGLLYTFTCKVEVSAPDWKPELVSTHVTEQNMEKVDNLFTLFFGPIISFFSNIFTKLLGFIM